jgi:hypothetical protein
MIRVLGVLGIGALAMYFFDPISGRRRRALLRDQLVHAQKEIGEYAEGTAKDLRNRAQGLAAKAKGAVERHAAERHPSSNVDIDLNRY